MSLADRHLSHRLAAKYGTGGRLGWQSAFCRQIGDKGKKFDITKEIIDQILVCSKNEIRSFRECYLACVSDARELMRINGIKDSFSVAMRNNDVTGCARENFKRIANILEGKK